MILGTSVEGVELGKVVDGVRVGLPVSTVDGGAVSSICEMPVAVAAPPGKLSLKAVKNVSTSLPLDMSKRLWPSG